MTRAAWCVALTRGDIVDCADAQLIEFALQEGADPRAEDHHDQQAYPGEAQLHWYIHIHDELRRGLSHDVQNGFKHRAFQVGSWRRSCAAWQAQ